jgi:hypothetical protein
LENKEKRLERQIVEQPIAKVKATLIKVDVEKKTLTVKIDDKETTLAVGKEVKFVGPEGGKATIKDNRLRKDAPLGLVMDGKTLKEVHLPYRKDIPGYKGKAKAADKDKEKDKGKDKDAKEKDAKEKDAKDKDAKKGGDKDKDKS